jgi:hypothetical protein
LVLANERRRQQLLQLLAQLFIEVTQDRILEIPALLTLFAREKNKATVLFVDQLDRQVSECGEALLRWANRNVFFTGLGSELGFDEIKTHLNGRELLLRSKTPRGIVQELYGLLLAHRLIRQVVCDAAATQKLDPDRLSFSDSLRVLQCHLHEAPTQSVAAWYACLVAEVSRQQLRPRRNRWYPRVVKRKMKKWDKKRPIHHHPPQPTKPFAESMVIL